MHRLVFVTGFACWLALLLWNCTKSTFNLSSLSVKAIAILIASSSLLSVYYYLRFALLYLTIFTIIAQLPLLTDFASALASRSPSLQPVVSIPHFLFVIVHVPNLCLVYVFSLQWTTHTVLCRSDSLSSGISSSSRYHVSRSETWEPTNRCSWISEGSKNWLIVVCCELSYIMWLGGLRCS